MTDDPYKLEADLSAIDSGDEFDGLDMAPPKPVRKKTSKLAYVVLGLAVVGVGGFFAYDYFMGGSGYTPPAPVAVPNNNVMTPPPAFEADGATSPGMPGSVPGQPPMPMADGSIPPMPPQPMDPNAPADPNAPVDPTVAGMPPADMMGMPPAPAAPGMPGVPAPTADAAVPPANPGDAAATPPTTDATAPVAETTTTVTSTETTPADPVTAEPAKTTTTVTTTTTSEPKATDVPPAEASKQQLKPIDPEAVIAKAEGKPAPVEDDKKGIVKKPETKKEKTAEAVKDILDGTGVMTPQAEAALSEQVEVTPRAKQVIIVKKTYAAKSSEAVNAAGDRVMQAGQYVDAIAIYDQQLAKNPSDPAALSGKAQALQHAGRTEEAMQAYERLLDLNPRDVDALTNYLGLLQKQDPEQALSRLEDLAQQYPTSAAVTGQLAMVYAANMDTPNALRAFQRAIALDQNNPTYVFNMAVLYDRLGTTDKARTAYLQTLGIMRDNPDRAAGIPADTIRQRLRSLSE